MVGAHHHPHKVGRRGELRGAVVRQGGSRRLVRRLAYQQVAQERPQQLKRLKREHPQRTRMVWRRWGFSMKFGVALSTAGDSVTATLFLLQISPSSVLSSASSLDTTLGVFLLAFLRGSFLRSGLEERQQRVDQLVGIGPGRRRSPQQSSGSFESPPPACGIWLWRVA